MICATKSNKIKAISLVVLAGLALAGCGRRGDLEAPQGSTPPAAGDVARETGSGSPVDGTTIRRMKVVPPRDPFILDKIL